MHHAKLHSLVVVSEHRGRVQLQLGLELKAYLNESFMSLFDPIATIYLVIHSNIKKVKKSSGQQ